MNRQEGKGGEESGVNRQEGKGGEGSGWGE